MFDIRQNVSSYICGTEQKPPKTYAINTRYSGVVVVRKKVNKIDSKKVDKFLQNNKVSSEAAALPLLITPYIINQVTQD